MLQDPAKREKAFGILVSSHKRRLYWHIRTMVLDHDDADDVLQEVFVRIFRNIDNFRGDSALFTWMFRIATNESLSFLKSKANRMKMSLESLQQELVLNLRSDPYFDGDELELKLQEAIISLPEKQQQVFRLKYLQEMKYEEMSEILETSVGSLKASYYHARKKIEKRVLKTIEK